METNTLLAFGLGILLVYLLGRAMLVPFKWIFKLIVNALVGGFVLWIINFFAAYIDLHIPLNPVTALIVGFLGIPGTILLVVVQQIIVN